MFTKTLGFLQIYVYTHNFGCSVWIIDFDVHERVDSFSRFFLGER